HLVEVPRVEMHAAGGTVGAGLTAARGGSTSGTAAPRFAAGGSVVRRPLWRTVPGTGHQDTPPAGLQAGSFVVKKAASQHYGDALLGAVARGQPVQHLAIGGIAKRIFDGFRGGSHLLGKPGSAAGLSLGAGATGEIVE